MQLDYDLICKEVPDFAQFPLTEFMECRMLTASRIFGISVNGVKTDGFVPLADMLNHKRPRTTSWYYCDERQGFIIEAIEDIPRGEQIYDSYGRKCNSRFFLNYGFINQPNDADEVPITIWIDETDPLCQAKLNMINEGKRSFKFRARDNLDEIVMLEMMSWTRYAVFDEEVNILFIIKNDVITAE